MATTVADIVSVPALKLRLLAGEANAATSSIRSAHVSELEDPTPWLQGGELLLTTGMNVGSDAAAQRAYVQRLAAADLAGLGFGLGFSHDRVPKPLVTAAEKAGFPVFEVPYPVPFIAISETVFTRLVAGQYDALQRAVAAEHVLTRAVMDGSGIVGVARSLGEAIGGWVLLLDLHGVAIAATGRGDEPELAVRVREEVLRSRPEGGSSFSLTMADGDDHIWVQPVASKGRIEAFLAVGSGEPAGQFERIVAAHALSLFAIELSKERAVAEVERRLQGDFFDELVGGELSAEAAAVGLGRFGFRGDAATRIVVLSMEGGDPTDLAIAIADERSRAGGGFLVRPREDGVGIILPADPALDLATLAADLETRLGTPVRIGAGGSAVPSAAGRSLRESRYALRVCALEGWSHAGFEDLGTYRLLLSMAEPDALRAFADAILSPLDAYDRDAGGDLIASLEAFLRRNARWESAAADLHVHRHTLRYRMRKIEELTGRDMGSSFDRMELWLALRARELLAASPA